MRVTCVAHAVLSDEHGLDCLERKEKNLPLDDFSYKIVLHTACAPEKVPEAWKPLYGYLNDSQKSQLSTLTCRINAL